MKKKSALIEKCKNYINMHKGQMKIAHKIVSIKPEQKPKKCNLKQRDFLRINQMGKNQKGVNEPRKTGSHIHCSEEKFRHLLLAIEHYHH